MAIGEQKLEITLPPAIAITYQPTKESQRWQQNWITSTDPTARGITVVKGVSVRSPIYRWQIKTKIPYWKALRLDEINLHSQRLLGESNPDGKITLEDKVWLTSSSSAVQPNRTILQTFTLNDENAQPIESGSYCSFQVELILPNSFSSLIQGSVFEAEDLNKIVDVTFDLKEY
jgi:hypothetical protein